MVRGHGRRVMPTASEAQTHRPLAVPAVGATATTNATTAAAVIFAARNQVSGAAGAVGAVGAVGAAVLSAPTAAPMKRASWSLPDKALEAYNEQTVLLSLKWGLPSTQTLAPEPVLSLISLSHFDCELVSDLQREYQGRLMRTLKLTGSTAALPPIPRRDGLLTAREEYI